MKKIRNKTFETNSSSTHAITVNRNVELPTDDGRLYVSLGEFGWEFDTYHKPADILSYMYTAICIIYEKDFKYWRDKVEKVITENTKYTMNWEEPQFEKYSSSGGYYLENGSIDHCDLEEWLNDLFANEKLLLDTVFGGTIYTGNDNSEEPLYGENINNDTTYEYYKGN